MAKEKPRVRHLPPAVLSVGWVVLTVGILWMLYGGGRLLFVVSMDFTPEEISYGTSIDPTCAATAEDLATCEVTFFGTIGSANGAFLTYTSQTEFDAAVATLRAQQRIKSAVVLISGIAAAALGLSLVAAGEHQRKDHRSVQRRSTGTRRKRQ